MSRRRRRSRRGRARTCRSLGDRASIRDVLASVGRAWAALHGIAPFRPRFEGSLRTPDGLPWRVRNGRLVTADGRLDEARPPDLVILPAPSLDRGGAVPAELSGVASWLAACHAVGAIVASVGSGALAERFPDVEVRRGRPLVPAGEGHRVITTGGMTAWADTSSAILAARFAARSPRDASPRPG